MTARRSLPTAVLAVLLVLGVALAPLPVAAQGAAQSQMTWAVHISLAPQWFDPGEHQIQWLAHERVTAAPPWELGFINAVGPRVDESGIGLIVYHPCSVPYEDLKLKK
jgi:hypothetical protein